MSEPNPQIPGDVNKPVAFKDGLLIYDGKEYALNSDLITAKKVLEKQLTDLRESSATAINSASAEKDKHYQAFLGEKAAKEQIENQLKELSEVKEKSDELQKNLEAKTTSEQTLNERLLGLTRDLIAMKYGVGVASLEGKTLEQLNMMDEALKLTGRKPSYDGGGGGTPAGSAGGELFAVEKAEIAEAKQNAGKSTEQ